jgi:GDPmannose 4,6-dehydratase
MKKALITGITGQCGSYLGELLLSKNYKVDGFVRPSTRTNRDNISAIIDCPYLKLIEGDVSDLNSVYTTIENGNYDEVYNLAAQSHVHTSFNQPSNTFMVNALGPMYFLEAIRRFSPNTKFYQASTSELFGNNISIQNDYDYDIFDANNFMVEKYQDEETGFMPQSPYAIAKLVAHNYVRVYREAYGLHASAGILFNNESPRRGENFVTRKITKWIADYQVWLRKQQEQEINGFELDYNIDENHIVVTRQTINLVPYGDPSFSWLFGSRYPKLHLGNLDAYRDWGHSKDYMEAVWLMLQQDKPDDYVIATGQTHSVRDFLREAFEYVGIDNFENYIIIDPELYRPAEVDYLKGKPDKARRVLGWEPKISFSELVRQMVDGDMSGQKKNEDTTI